MATQAGSLTLTDVDTTTSGANSAPLATDRGGGTIAATGGDVLASGQDSPALYSTGAITVTGGNLQGHQGGGSRDRGREQHCLEQRRPLV
jgi:hypothetical protein